ncbi:MauE/DoxX family redox-associated membrane protein [Aquimarina sp. 2304DJ70-9]|uniref:MauE/DoxX family redox-associated membrane protein n=1 Tax=Aquimarina penaris TaxID=3231044 RepID=UPI0034631032
MKFKIYLYSITRVSFGMVLMLHSIYNAIKYSGFLDRLDRYFNRVTIFDNDIIEAMAPLVPFEEFVIGFFLILGMFTKKALMVSTVLFAFFTLFLLDANFWYCAGIHLFLCMISVILLRKNDYDLNSVESYRISF